MILKVKKTLAKSRNWYNDSNCFVYIARENSELFKISQGIGQERVLIAFVILVYIDDLLNDLICNFSKGVREFR